MKVFDVFDPDLNVHQPFLLEASAGTGKTFSIENIVVRAILDDPKDGKGPLSIKDILVVTFTKAAAKELKSRILANLQKTADHLQKSGESPENLQKIKKALIEFDLANISTIHSFCYRALAENATVYRMNKNPEDLSADKVWKVLERHFHTRLTNEFYTPTQLNILLKPYQSGITGLSRDLIQTIGRGIGFAKTENNSFHLDHLKTNLAKLQLETFENYAFSYKGLCKGTSKTLNPEYQRALSDFIQHFSLSEELYTIFSLFSSKNLKVKAKPPEEIIAFFDEIYSTFVPSLYALGHFDPLFTRLSAECQAALHAEFEETETGDYSFLLLKMERLIAQDQDFRKRLKKRYRMAIIDEFQDTDPLQWKIFKSLFSHGNFPFILVGDPKQSIYAFRSADIYTYLNAAGTISSDSQFLLSTNYRSTPELISALNHLFHAEQAPGWIALPYLKKNLPYIPVKAPETKLLSEAAVPALEFLYVESDLKLQEIEELYLFPKFLKEVQAIQKERGIPLSQFAFLVRDHMQSDRLLQFFQSKNLPAVQMRALKLEKAIILPDLIHLLRAIGSPRRLNYVQLALGTRFFNWSTSDLEQLKDQDYLSKILLHFNQWHQILKRDGIAIALETVLSTHFIKDSSIQEALIESFEGLKRYHELRQLMEWLSNRESSEKLSLNALIEELESILSVDHPQQEHMKMRPLVEKEAVQILTLHLSKGLEFEVVFALGIVNRPPIDKGLVLVREQDNMALKAVQEDDPAYLDFLEENDAEKSRQLYVALTRAKSKLYIPCIEGWKTPSLGGASPLELWLARLHEPECSWRDLYTRLGSPRFSFLETLANGSPHIAIEKLNPEGCAPFLSQVALPELIAPYTIALDFPKLFTLSFSSLAKAYTKERLVTPPHDFNCMDKTPYTLPAGAYTGELLHQILEEIPFSLIRMASKPADLRNFIHKFTAKTPFEAWEDVLSLLIYQAFKTPIYDLLLEDLMEEQTFREMEFLYPAELANHLPECRNTKGQVTGVMDLFFKLNGKYYLLDWKSNWLESYEAHHLKAAIEENRYDLQAALYKRALQEYLSNVTDQPFEEIYGGAIYYFLRANAGVLLC